MDGKGKLDLNLQHHDIDHDVQPATVIAPVLELDPNCYPGGIAVWGALPAIYDTTRVVLVDEGVHVHARKELGGKKEIDQTYSIVRVKLARPDRQVDTFEINGTDASYYNIGAILKFKLKYLRCPECRNVHSDRDWYAVNYHQQHTCEKCGVQFEDSEPSISNPVLFLKELCGDVLQDRPIIDPVERILHADQSKYRWGMQLWGSNPAVIWTSSKLEEGGVHFHGFYRDQEIPTVDETYGILYLDGIQLDPEMVRHLMAQQALPFLTAYLCALTCPKCQNPHFDKFDKAVHPHESHVCEHCGLEFSSPPEMPMAVSNPMVKLVDQFYARFYQLYPGEALPNVRRV